MAGIPWALINENVVGRGHATLADVANRAVRFILSMSGINPDAPIFQGLFGPVHNIIAYGADAAGVLDCTAAINLAISTAAVTGGVVHVPAGTFKSTGQISGATNVTLRGLGPNLSIINGAFAGGIGVYTVNQTNFHIKNIGFQGTLAMGVAFFQCLKVSVRRCQFIGLTSSTHPTGYCGGVYSWVSDDVEISDNYFSGNGYTGAGLCADIQVNGNGNNTGSLRVRVMRNRCLSTGVQSNIAFYDVASGEASDNYCSGALSGAGNNNGYGIVFYRTTGMTSGVMGHFKIIRNSVSFVQGSGIYCQASSNLLVSLNDVWNACSVQDDSTLAAGGIAFSNCFDVTCTSNNVRDSGRAGIVVAGLPSFMVQPTDGRPAGIEGFVIMGNLIDGVTLGTRPTGILIRGPLDRSQITKNTIRGAFCGIGTLPASPGRTTSNSVGVGDGSTTNGSPNIVSVLAQFSARDVGVSVFGTGIPDNAYIQSVTDASHAVLNVSATATSATVIFTIGGITDTHIDDNVIEGTTGGRAVDIYCMFRSSLSRNTSYGAQKDAFALDYGYENDVSDNRAYDGGVLTTNTYIAFYMVNQRAAKLDGNRATNTGTVGFKWGIYMQSDCPKSQLQNNRMTNMLTAGYSVDQTAAAGIMWGANNYDSGSLSPMFPVLAKVQAVIAGAPASVVQLLLGDSSLYASVGTRASGGDPFLAGNASHTLGVDSWHQSNATVASKLWILRTNGDAEFYSAAIGTADGNFATFWGSPKVVMSATGQIKTSNGTFLSSTVALTNGAAAAAGTLANAPVAGNPTKWVPINDNGTTRYIPAW